jgi:hypothetical protein
MNKGPYVVTKYDLASTIVEESPRAAELLSDYGLACTGCYFNEQDTLETGAKIHGMTESEIDDMIEEVNGQMETEWQKEHKSI